VHFSFRKNEFVLELFIALLSTRISIVAEVSKTPQLERAAAQAAARVAPRRRSLDRRLRILERLTIGLSIAYITGVEQLMARRVRR
jgi:hypothetical protein